MCSPTHVLSHSPSGLTPDPECAEQACTEEDEADLEHVGRQSLGTTEVEGQWWSTNPEGDKQYQARISELLSQVQYSAHECIVLVAHADTQHELLTRHLHEDAAERQAELVAQLVSQPPQPCSMLYCTLDFRRGAGSRPITDIALVDDALFHEHAARRR